MRSQLWKQRIAIDTLLNISKSTGNRTLNFSQLIQYIMENVLLEKSYTNCCGETVPRLFSRK